MQTNSSLEALAIGPDGALYAMPERSGLAMRPFPVYRLQNGVWDQPFGIPRSGPYLLSGADIGPDGRLYVLKRDFIGVGFRNRAQRFDLDGTSEEILLETRVPTHENLEGISARQDGQGLRMTLIYDGNFRTFQRTEIVEYWLTDYVADGRSSCPQGWGPSAAPLSKRINQMTRILPGVIAMATIVVASNILVQFLILDGFLTWGAFTYPLAFLVTDVMNRVYGVSAARKVVFAGLISGIICSLIGSQIMLQGDGYEYPAVALRIAIGSASAFLVAQLLDIAAFNRLRKAVWWKAPLASTLIGSFVDTTIFFSIAFSSFFNGLSANSAEEVMWAQDAVPFLSIGPMVPLWVSLAVADWGVKITIALFALIPFRIIVGQMQENAK
jgi:uncharacterized integral membrane protein (TIGR00697 family)